MEPTSCERAPADKAASGFMQMIMAQYCDRKGRYTGKCGSATVNNLTTNRQMTWCGTAIKSNIAGRNEFCLLGRADATLGFLSTPCLRQGTLAVLLRQ